MILIDRDIERDGGTGFGQDSKRVDFRSWLVRMWQE